MLGESGNTVARYTVLPDGSVSDVAVLKSSGSLRLDEATVTFVKGFKFKPALSNGAAVACSSEIMLQWSLHNEEPQAFDNLNIAPIYPTQSDFPPGAIARHEEGAAIAAIIVGETGIVELVALFRHTQFADLDAATVELLRKQKVTAPSVGGKPVRAVILMPVVWSLSGGPLPQPQGLADPQSGDGAQVKGPH
jgi:TonB family protein